MLNTMMENENNRFASISILFLILLYYNEIDFPV